MHAAKEHIKYVFGVNVILVVSAVMMTAAVTVRSPVRDLGALRTVPLVGGALIVVCQHRKCLAND